MVAVPHIAAYSHYPVRRSQRQLRRLIWPPASQPQKYKVIGIAVALTPWHVPDLLALLKLPQSAILTVRHGLMYLGRPHTMGVANSSNCPYRGLPYDDRSIGSQGGRR